MSINKKGLKNRPILIVDRHLIKNWGGGRGRVWVQPTGEPVTWVQTVLLPGRAVQIPGELRGDRLGEVCAPLTTAGRSTQAPGLRYCRAGENRLCPSGESSKRQATVVITTVTSA